MKRRELLLGALAARPAFGAAPRSITGKIVLGQSAALSGPAGELGLQFKQGAEILFEKVNNAGGVNGQTFELQSLDDGYEPVRCAANTRQLIADGVFALFGYVGTATSLAALPLATQAKKIFFAPYTGSEALRLPLNRYAFHLRASYVDEASNIVNHLTSVGIQRIGVFYQNDGDGKAGLLAVARALKKQYQTPAGLGLVERNSIDVAPAVQSVLAERPDAIVLVSTYQSCAAFIRAARKAGFEGVFYNVSLVGTQALARELGTDARGVVVSQVMPFPFTAATQISGEYRAAGQKALGDRFTPNYGSIEGYIAARTFVEALRRAPGTPSTDSVIASLESMRDYDLGGFRVDFSAAKHTGSRFIDLGILISDGRVRH